MKSLKRSTIALLIGIIMETAFSQGIDNMKDSTTILEPKQALTTVSETTVRKFWGLDLMFSENGFGLGGFYGRQYSETFTWKINFSISEAKDEREIELYDPYTGDTFSPLKVNRFLVFPLLFTMEYEMFRDEIMDNFRPYISAAVGPTVIFATPYEKEFFSSIKYGKAYYTGGGYLGFGAFFGSDRKRIMGVNLRYYIIPYTGGIESMYGVTKKEFGGFSVSISFGSGW
jgi:hypothetical protein